MCMYGYKVFFTFRLKGKSDLRAYYKPVETHDSLTFSPFSPTGSDFRTDISCICRFPYEPNKNDCPLKFQILILHSNRPGRREDSDDKGSLPERTTVTSILRFKPSAGDNLANIACEAQHPALQSRPLRASVKMFVQCKFCI